MNKLVSVSPVIGLLVMASGSAYAFSPQVPEIDTTTAAIAIGLAVVVVALIREHRRKK